MRPPTHLLYLHGFRSSPRSMKSRLLGDWLALHRPDVRLWCPQLPASPADALALVRAGIAGWPADASAVLDSSLGGCYAAALHADTGWPAVLLNPAVVPARDLALQVGDQPAFHAPDDPSQRVLFRAEFLDQLRAITQPRLAQPERCLAVIAKGDALLSWREMAAFCAGAELLLLDGSDHALSDFAALLPAVLRFLRLVD